MSLNTYSHHETHPASTSAVVMAKVYGWMSIGVLLSAVVGFLLQPFLLSGAIPINRFTFIAVGLVQMGVVFVMNTISETASTAVLRALFLLYAAMTGLTFAVLGLLLPAGVVISCFFLATIGFVGLAAFGALTKKDLGFLSTFLIMGSFMLLGMWILSFFFPGTFTLASGIVGVLVFGGFTAWDSQRLSRSAHVVAAYGGASESRFVSFGALEMYMNFIGLFISLVKIFLGSRRSN